MIICDVFMNCGCRHHLYHHSIEGELAPEMAIGQVEPVVGEMLAWFPEAVVV